MFKNLAATDLVADRSRRGRQPVPVHLPTNFKRIRASLSLKLVGDWSAIGRRLIGTSPRPHCSNAILWEKIDNSKLLNVYKHKWLVPMFTNKDILWVISALFIAQSFPKWFVHFWMTFCKISIRISCQIIFVTKHWPKSCLCSFNPLHNSRILYVTADDLSVIYVTAHIYTGGLNREKNEEIWLSPMTKATTPTEKSEKQRDNTKNATNNFDYTTIADRLRTVSWSNDSHRTGVV